MKFIKTLVGYEFYELSAEEQAKYGEIYIGVKAGDLNIIDFSETKIAFKGSSLDEIDAEWIRVFVNEHIQYAAW